MQCTNCLTYNSKSASFCDQCGAALGRAARPGGARPLLWGLLALAVVGGGLFVVLKGDPAAPPPAPTPTETAARSPVGDSGPTERDVADVLNLIEDAPREVAVGRIRVFDRWDGTVRDFVGAVVSGSWVALPRRAVLGGARLSFRPDEPDEADFAAAVWQEGEELMLWQLETGEEFEGPTLVPWDEGRRLEWLPFDGSPRQRVTVTDTEDRDLYLVFSLPIAQQRPGVLVQEGFVVGWTFGSTLDGGWLWNGDRRGPATPEVHLEDFYRMTFSRGREEYFAEAIARQEDLLPDERLSLYARGFREGPRLEERDTPAPWGREPALVEVRNLASLLYRRDQSSAVVAELQEDVLIAIDDVGLLLGVLESYVAETGVERTLAMLDRVVPALSEMTAEETGYVEKLRRQLMVSWIRGSIQESLLDDAWYAWEFASRELPTDDEIHLYGVEILIALLDLDGAEDLLGERRYSGEQAARARELADQIRNLRVPADGIVIRFPPGSRSMITTGTLNGRRDQRFIIDTGATTTTIPSRMARALGLDTAGADKVAVDTAGGRVIVPRVRLDSVDVAGAVVTGVTVLVLDLEGQGESGLLGLNFLNNFRYEIDNARGTLVLQPK